MKMTQSAKINSYLSVSSLVEANHELVLTVPALDEATSAFGDIITEFRPT